MPFGTDAYRKSVIEQYWKLDASSGWGPANVLATCGGRDALVKIYQAMMALGHGRQGDLVMVSRVPWISYNWGPYGVGATVLWAPGDPDQGWAYSEDAIQESVRFAESKGRKLAGLVITNPDNPTGLTIPVEKQVSLAKCALDSGVAFVLFNWMYHYVTDESPMDLNSFLRFFTAEERKRIMFLDGITKSLGSSNIRNCHLLADEAVIKFITARASHGVIPSFFSLAVRYNDLRNGIALSKNAHWQFDHGLWSLNDDYRILMNRGKFIEEGVPGQRLADFEGRRIFLPSDLKYWPEQLTLLGIASSMASQADSRSCPNRGPEIFKYSFDLPRVSMLRYYP